ncbi:uncharacterized protein LOC135685741 [Rhopilema esculentum]|uniref:uncharacterized protein LOC135685741 n=1 Tax=Rhopilema esculentum TaxID=499914 RepID=UPI0031E37B24
MDCKKFVVFILLLAAITIVLSKPNGDSIKERHNEFSSVQCTPPKEDGLGKLHHLFLRDGEIWRCVDDSGSNNCKEVGLFPNEIEDCERCCSNAITSTRSPDSRTWPTEEIKARLSTKKLPTGNLMPKPEKTGRTTKKHLFIGFLYGGVPIIVVVIGAIGLAWKCCQKSQDTESENAQNAEKMPTKKMYVGIPKPLISEEKGSNEQWV